MGDSTAIGWTEKTWNPWHGCTKISPGCKFCFMYRDKARYGQDPTKIVRSKTTFCAPLKWHDPALVFTCSWSDFFIQEADLWRDDAWNVIRSTPHLTYQILTKRPERIPQCLPKDWDRKDLWRHVQLGVSVESAEYRWRLMRLLEIPAALHFASFEPLIGEVGNIVEFLPHCKMGSGMVCGHRSLGWAIIGGESGPERRDMSMEAFESLVEQLRGFVPVYVKQDSALHSGQQGRIPNDLWLKEFPA
jgi:protein gp37